LGDKPTKARGKGSELSLYDFRHSSACYWLPIYKSRSSLLYRFGWAKESQIHYYTELLGMRDTIAEEDLLTTLDKTEMQKEIATLKEKLSQHDGFFKLLQENPQWQTHYNKIKAMKVREYKNKREFEEAEV
jgi:hypothetical protein